MNFTKRDIQFLKILLGQVEYKPVSFYSKILNISTRTLYSQINCLNEKLDSVKLSVEKKQGSGIKLTGLEESKVVLKNMIEGAADVQKMSVSERQFSILKMLLIDEMTLSYNQMSEQFYVSKTSLTKDIRKIIQIFPEGFIISNQKGTRVDGSETELQNGIKKFINYYLEEIKEDNKNTEVDNDLIQISRYLSKMFPEEHLKAGIDFIQKINEVSVIENSEWYLKSFYLTLVIFLFRLSKGKHPSVKLDIKMEKLDNLETFSFVEVLLGEMCLKLNLEYTSEDIIFIKRQIIAHGLSATLDYEADTKEYVHIVNSLIKEMSDVLHIDMTSDISLKKGLLLHFIPMIYRLRMGIKIANPLLEDIKKQYSIIYDITYYKLQNIESKLKVSFTEDEVGFIVIYFQAAIERNEAIKKIWIVCPSGIGTSQLISNKIKRIFLNNNSMEVVSLREFYKRDVEEADMIVSSVKLDIKDSHTKILYVSPLLTEKDIKNISYEYAMLMSESNASSSKLQFNYLQDYVDEDFIFTECRYKTKEECLNKLIRVLKEKDLVNDDFEENIFNREKLGATDLDSGVALPHAFPETVKKTKVLIMTLEKPIKWNERFVQTVILICISKEDLGKAKDILEEIYSIVEERSIVSEIFEHKTKQEILYYLNA